MAKRLFLLGGHDLEMEEIRKLLEENGCRKFEQGDEGDCFYADRDLGWGAKLSDYKDLLEFDGDIYGIELAEDIKTPNNYHRIDHHNSYWCRPSALEQVAERLDAELNRRQRLVAANDRGHIAALQAMGATPEEIERIRDEDMRAQGVTPEEKEQARREAESVEKRDGFHYVETTLEHTTPLVDLLVKAGKTPLVVVNKKRKSLNYYGESVLKLADKFQKEIDEKRAYYGGNPPGYFGFDKKYFDNHTFEEALELIAQTLQETTMHSYHIFMLPFVTGQTEPTPNNEKWKELPFAIKGEEATYRYNETTYFHDFVRPVLFNEKSGEGVSRYFEYTDQKGEYIIEVKDRTYRLELDGIALRHFKNGVGILSFHLINRRYDDFDDILRINDFGRRLFPQFLGDALVESTINNLLACSLTLALEGRKPMQERFDHYRDIEKIAVHPHRFPCFVEKLLGDAYAKSDFAPLIDDRMYVLCHLLHDKKAQVLTCYDNQMHTYPYEESDDWYRFVFVDNDQTNIQNIKMKRDLIAKSTYTRWSDYGTLFGITRYSFMLLTDDGWFAQNILNRHIRTVYFQMATLLLAYRAMILAFSNQIHKALKDDTYEARKKKSETLFRDYIEFQNRIYFREVTAQEQGIELFDMAKTQMRLDAHLQELNHDIAQLHDFIQLKIEDRRNKQGLLLNKIAAILLPAGLVSGILGMNFFPKSWENDPWMIVCGIILSVAGTFAILSKIRSEQ